jgi:hypothetical protein
MDWTSYIPSVTTAVVGLAGIGGSIWSARIAGGRSTENLIRSIGAQNELVRDANKRRLYAASLAAFNEMTAAFADFIDNRAEDQDEYETSRKRLYAAQRDMNGALEELMLIAPKDVGDKAVDMSDYLISLMRNAAAPDTKPDVKTAGLLRTRLIGAMREDLGESNW